MTGIPILVASQFDPGVGRIELTLPGGLTLMDIVRQTLPGVSVDDMRRVRVALVTERGSSIIEPALWHAVRPRPGVRVVVRLVPGKGALRAVLTVVVSIAAVAMSAMFAGPLAGALGISSGAASGLIGLGVNVVGSLLINALVPPVQPKQDKRPNDYTISGWRNRYDPDGAVPVVLGSLRYAPPFGAISYSEIEGDKQFVRALFLFGEGRLDLTDFRIGETSISEYDDVEVEVRYGLNGQLPVSLYPRQVLEEAIGVELTRPMPRDDAGNITDTDASIETPVVRTTAADTESVSIILGWPGGLVKMSDEGKKKTEGVDIRIEQRMVGADEWQLVDTLQIRAKRTDSFYRQHGWTFPTRGRWQIRLTMMTEEPNNPQRQRTTMWAALQSLRPEYPLALERPMALVAVRVRGTHQLSGQLDNFSARASRVCLDWDHASQSWVMRATSNPASLFRLVLGHPSNPKAVATNGMDLAGLQDWHDFCRVKGLTYNRVLDQAGMSLREVLTEIAAAGRASPRWDGMRWGVVIDRPSDLIVDHISPRNSWGFSLRRGYSERPHGMVVRFQDQTNDWKETQRVIPWPGYTGPIELTEQLDMPGITDPALIYREARRRMHEVMLRPDVYEVTQDGAVRVATRGDTVALSHDVLSKVQYTARVKDVSGNRVLMDDDVTMMAGQSYACRFRRITAADTVGTSHVRNVVTEPGTANILTLAGTGAVPQAGDLLFFGLAGQESYRLIVTQTEATEDGCTILRMADAAPEIEQRADTTQIPAWSGRVGAEIAENLIAPAAPRWTQVSSEITASGMAVAIDYLIVPGSGPVRSVRFQINHRLAGTTSWTSISIPVAAGGGSITGYSSAQEVEIRARAVSSGNVSGAWGPTVTHLVGSGGAGIPVALDTESVTVTALLGGGQIEFAVGSDPAVSKVQLYRSTSAVLDRATDKVGQPLAVTASQTFRLSVGDTTRQNLLQSGAWTAGAGWTVSGTTASHAAGTAGNLSQPLAATTGRWYRAGFTIASRTGGNLVPVLTGGSTVSGAAVSSNGRHAARLQAVSGNTSFALSANSTFNGTVSNIAAYLETAACLAQGTHYLWLEPQSEDGVPGPVTGPFTLEVI